MKTSYIDTHCHLNFKRFNKTRDEVLKEAQDKGIAAFIVPGTDITLSQKAVEIASQISSVYAAVGIHPHHTMEKLPMGTSGNQLETDMKELEKLIIHPKVVAVGEIGLDRHAYEETKYEDYTISDEFMEAQEKYFVAQIQLAMQYKKSLIIHNRETKKELLAILNGVWRDEMRFRTVFHCCEPDEELLAYAQEHNIYIGVDGDVTYGGDKATFAKAIPLDLLVLETDSPYLLPEPLRTKKLYPNTPTNIPLIAHYIADLKGVSVEVLAEATTRNAKKLFDL